MSRAPTCMVMILCSIYVAAAPQEPEPAQGPYSELVSSIHARIVAMNVSSYEKYQAHKLDLELARTRRRDTHVESDTMRFFGKSEVPRTQKSKPHYNVAQVLDHTMSFVGKTILCIGARLGGEVRAFTALGALAIGVDFNPGYRNPWVMWGSATALQFANSTFDYGYSNVLDHIDNPSALFLEIARVLRPGGLFFSLVDHNKPDRWSVRDNRRVSHARLSRVIAVAGLHIKRREHFRFSKSRHVLFSHYGGTTLYVLRKL